MTWRWCLLYIEIEDHDAPRWRVAAWLCADALVDALLWQRLDECGFGWCCKDPRGG
jgi:hypothetical protein